MGTPTPVRRHRKVRRHRRWLTSYRPRPDRPIREHTAATREEAEAFARGLPDTVTAVEVLYVDGGGWCNPYPIRSVEEAP